MWFNNIHKEIPAKLLMIGDTWTHDCEQMAREFHIADDRAILGKPDLGSALRCWFVLMPSEPKKVLDWPPWKLWPAGARDPTNTGGLPELNIQGKTGFMQSNLGDIARTY